MSRLCLFILVLLLFSCAEIVPPTGGEKDTSPPKIVSLYPQNGALLFTEKKIEVKFNEFVKIKSSGDNIFISPPLKTKPKYELLGKKLIIRFQEELLENTTYSINFGEAIEDYNESNKLKDFIYIFSTGNFLDSLSYSGQILDAFNKKPVENTLVLLYPEKEDSVLYKRPIYFSKTDENGHFSIKNIKTSKYNIAALEDKNQNLLFDQSAERVSFKEKALSIDSNITNETLYLFENIKDISIINKNNKEANHIFFEFNKAFSSVSLDISNYTEKDIVYYSEDKKRLHYWYTNKKDETHFFIDINKKIKDTISASLYVDSLNSSFNIDINTDLQEEKNVLLLTFPYPVNDFSGFLFELKDQNNKTIPYVFEWDKHKLNLSIKTNQHTDSINLSIKEGCFTSFHNKTNTGVDELLSEFKSHSTNLKLNIPFSDKNIILQLIDQKNEIIAEQNVSRETSVLFKSLKSGNYFIRIFEDKNQNALWDSGLFHVKQFPEITLFFSEQIDVKANWDKELDVKF